MRYICQIQEHLSKAYPHSSYCSQSSYGIVIRMRAKVPKSNLHFGCSDKYLHQLLYPCRRLPANSRFNQGYHDLVFICESKPESARMRPYLNLFELPPRNRLQHNSRSISSKDYPLARFHHLRKGVWQRCHIPTDMEPVPFEEQASPATAQHREHIGYMRHTLEGVSLSA